MKPGAMRHAQFMARLVYGIFLFQNSLFRLTAHQLHGLKKLYFQSQLYFHQKLVFITF